MVPQSRATAVLLTRPAAQSERFATALRARFGALRIVISPVLVPEILRPTVPERAWTGVIFTSETGVLAARRIAADGVVLPKRAFCVGDQTARVAEAAGFEALSAEGDGQALRQRIQAEGAMGPLLYLHGAEVRVDIGTVLNSANIETVSVVCYVQQAEPLTPEAVMLLRGADPLLVPVFSRRSGQLLMREYDRVGGTAPLQVVAISADAAVDLPTASLTAAKRPDAAAMLEAMALWLA